MSARAGVLELACRWAPVQRTERGAGALGHPRRVGPALLFYLVVAIVYTFPLAFRLSTSILKGGLGDYITEVSIVAWNARQILHDPLRLHDLPFYYPYSHTVAYQQSQFFTGLLAAPWLALGATLLFLANLFVVAALVASGTFMYLLAYSLTSRVLPSLLAAWSTPSSRIGWTTSVSSPTRWRPCRH
jgi:hypothetical protein